MLRLLRSHTQHPALVQLWASATTSLLHPPLQQLTPHQPFSSTSSSSDAVHQQQQQPTSCGEADERNRHLLASLLATSNTPQQQLQQLRAAWRLPLHLHHHQQQQQHVWPSACCLHTQHIARHYAAAVGGQRGSGSRGGGSGGPWSSSTSHQQQTRKQQQPHHQLQQPPGPSNKPKMRCNAEIRARSLMVVFPDGARQVLSLADARAAAEGLGLDLVEVAAAADPPVARILDYGKLRYEQQQKAEAADKQRRLQQKFSTPKEMQFSARIADHDLEVKMRKVSGWLEEGYRVQLVVKHKQNEEEAAAEALAYLATRVQSEFKVEVGQQQVQRRAVTVLVKPLKQG